MDFHDNPILNSQVSAAIAPPPPRSAPSLRINEAKALLAPADPEDILDQLLPILALTAGVGMSQDDRTEWLGAAVDALKEMPADLLKAAIGRARLHCDHPSKVIPFVMRDVNDAWNWRRKHMVEVRDEAQRHSALPAPGQSYCTAEEAAEIVNAVFPQARDLAPVKTSHVPTVADYIALGHSPEAAARFMEQYHKTDKRQVGQLVSQATQWDA